MTMWMPSRESLSHPLYAGLAAALRDAIAAGQLAPGTQLSPHRIMADSLHISVHTVSKAYEELRRLGLVEGQVGRGTYVMTPAMPSRQPFLMERGRQDIIDLSISRPLYDVEHVKAMEAGLAGLPISLDPSTYLACRPNIGLLAHRQRGRDWLARCGLDAPEESIIMTNGVCHGMSTALASLTKPGDTVVTEAVTHHLIVSLCAYLGVRLHGLEMDHEGVRPEAFEAACRAQEVKVFFTVPTLAGPTVHLMPEGRRRQLVEIARHHDVMIIEDDAWGPVLEDRPPPIASLAPERTIYLTSFTKCILPGLRVGYLVAPVDLVPTLTGRLIVFGWMATPLISELASRWVEDGTADRLVAWQRRELARRHAIVVEEMSGLNWNGHPAALHFWLRLPDNWDSATAVDHARALGVAVAPSQSFLTAQSGKVNAIRVALGGGHDISRFRQGLVLLRKLLEQPPEPLWLHAF